MRESADESCTAVKHAAPTRAPTEGGTLPAALGVAAVPRSNPPPRGLGGETVTSPMSACGALPQPMSRAWYPKKRMTLGPKKPSAGSSASSRSTSAAVKPSTVTFSH